VPVEECFNEGDVRGRYSVGGIVGVGAELVVCMNLGDVFGASYIGGIAGESWGEEIMGCANEGSVTQTDRSMSYCSAGGIAGNLGSNTRISFCENYGDVTATGGTGGIVGCVYGSEEAPLTDCFNYGSISGTDHVGGIVGECGDNAVYSCVNEGTVTGENNVGGLVGYLSSGELSHSVNRGNVHGSKERAGGLTGCLAYGGACKNCVNLGVVTGFMLYGKLIGEADGSEWSGCELFHCYSAYQKGVNRVAQWSYLGWGGLADVTVSTQNGRTTYTLDTVVTAADYSGTDLLEAMNHYAAYAYTEEDVIEREEWGDEVYEYLTYKARRPCFWTQEEGRLLPAYGIGARSERGGDCEFVGVLPWEVLDHEEADLLAARYDGGKMTAVDGLAWGDDWLVTADLVGRGDQIRLFVLGEDHRPLREALELS